jgi:hypothetical protein
VLQGWVDAKQRVGNVSYYLVLTASVIEQRKIPDSARIELSVGDEPPVKAPPECVPKEKLLLVDPV